MPRTLDFLFSPVDPPKKDSKPNPLAKESTNQPEIIEALHSKFGDAITGVTFYANEHTVFVETSKIADVCAYLRADFGFDYLSDLGGIDRFTDEDRFEVFYNIISMERGKRIRLKVRVDEEDPVVPTIVNVHPSADWNERECWDMLGIKFEGHPDLRRIYLPEDFEYHPQRKEFPSLGVPGSLPLPSQTDDGRTVEDPFPAAHGSKPQRRTPFPE
jgi:NADH-quinone oxidoreductase subunit C